MTDQITHKVSPTKIKVGDLMAFTYWGKVEGSNRREVLAVRNVNDNQTFNVVSNQMIEQGLSADQYAEEVKATKTEIAELLINAANRPLSVCFEKANGSERVLRGRLIKPEPLLGRSMCEDMDIDNEKDRLRLVDHRTIKWLVVDGVKYTTKK